MTAVLVHRSAFSETLTLCSAYCNFCAFLFGGVRYNFGQQTVVIDVSSSSRSSHKAVLRCPPPTPVALTYGVSKEPAIVRRMAQSVVCRHVQHACRDAEQHRGAHLSVEGASKGFLLEL
jgi:hypothetical protein